MFEGDIEYLILIQDIDFFMVGGDIGGHLTEDTCPNFRFMFNTDFDTC